MTNFWNQASMTCRTASERLSRHDTAIDLLALRKEVLLLVIAMRENLGTERHGLCDSNPDEDSSLATKADVIEQMLAVGQLVPPEALHNSVAIVAKQFSYDLLDEATPSELDAILKAQNHETYQTADEVAQLKISLNQKESLESLLSDFKMLLDSLAAVNVDREDQQ